MADVPVTQYASTSGGGSVAYQITGAGPIDLLVMHGDPVPTDLLWEEPGCVRVRDRLGSFSRTIWIDVRGFGSSDRDLAVDEMLDMTLADEQVAAVCDAVGCERVAVFACSVQGPTAIHYAALNPERVHALVLYATFASYVRDDDCPWGYSTEALARFAARFGERWGTGPMVDVLAPRRAGDQRFREWAARGQRLGLNPAGSAERIRARYEQDVRALLETLQVPTLVIHRRDDAVIRVAAGRYLAEHIGGAKYLELPGQDHYFFTGDSDAIVDEIEEFLTGTRTGAEGDVIVSTIVFTDIADSTRQEAALGHRAWSKLTAEHDAMVRASISRHRGREIKTLGDGFLATFDGASRATRCAAEIVTGARDIGLTVRAGVHTGEVQFGDGDVAGLAVSIGKRVCDLAPPGQALVTETVRGSVVGSDIVFDDAGEHTLKGIPGAWHLHSVRA